MFASSIFNRGGRQYNNIWDLRRFFQIPEYETSRESFEQNRVYLQY